MSGTSVDAVDAALVDFTHHPPILRATISLPISQSLKNNINALMQSAQVHLQLLGETDTQLGHLFADACVYLLEKSHYSKSDIAAIGSHGQTLYHQPNHTYPFTLQIGDPNIIAERTGITTIADFRRRDLALGGQAAPLAPAFHANLFQRKTIDQWVVNIGGIANVTLIPANQHKKIIGFDTGPGNTLLDLWHQKHRHTPIDYNGDWAKSGMIHTRLLSQLLNDPYFKQSSPKSTGRDYFHLHWLEKHITDTIKPVNIQTTLTELTAKTIASAIHTHSQSGLIWVCGGGAFNQFLMSRLHENCGVGFTVQSTDAIGINPKWIEAMAFAWLAKQTLEKKPGNLPEVTGAKNSAILGAIYLGS